MSVNAITNAAIARRVDFEPANRVPEGLGQIADAAAKTASPADAGGTQPQVRDQTSTVLQTLTTYIPTEILTLYVSALGAVGATPNNWTPWVMVWAFLFVTPLAVWLAFAAKLRSAGKALPVHPEAWPLWEMVAATVAFSAWAFALPNNPFSIRFKTWYSPGMAGFLVLVVSWGLGAIAPLMQRPLAEGPAKTG